MKPILFPFAGALALLLVSACVPQPKPTPPVQTRPTPTAAPPPTAAPISGNWLDAPQTPGDWSLQLGSGFTVAAFGEAAGEPRFALRCNLATRQVDFVRSGEAAAGATMRIVTETRTATLPAQTVPGPTPAVSASVPGTDRLLDAMALSKGRFAVEVAGSETLYLPSWAEVTRVIEDCR